jgi:hypothetical protein
MTQITSIKLGVIAICVATVPLSLAQMPRSRTSGSNQTGGAAPGLAGSSGNATGATQTGANARAGTNSTANTNAGAHTGAAAATPTKVNILEPQFTPVPTPRPLLNNNALGTNFATPGESPSPLPSASVTPTPTPTPAQSL